MSPFPKPSFWVIFGGCIRVEFRGYTLQPFASGMVIDEAQKIKNHGAQVSRAVKEVGNAIGHTRIALSGAGFGWGGLNLEGGLFDVERPMYSVNVVSMYMNVYKQIHK